MAMIEVPETKFVIEQNTRLFIRVNELKVPALQWIVYLATISKWTLLFHSLELNSNGLNIRFEYLIDRSTYREIDVYNLRPGRFSPGPWRLAKWPVISLTHCCVPTRHWSLLLILNIVYFGQSIFGINTVSSSRYIMLLLPVRFVKLCKYRRLVPNWYFDNLV